MKFATIKFIVRKSIFQQHLSIETLLLGEIGDFNLISLISLLGIHFSDFISYDSYDFLLTSFTALRWLQLFGFSNFTSL